MGQHRRLAGAVAGLGGEDTWRRWPRRRPAGLVRGRRRRRRATPGVRRLPARSSARPAGAGCPGSGRSAGRTPRAPWRSGRRGASATRPSPTASAAIRMRSGFMPCRMYWNPLPSSPMRSSSGTLSPSMNSMFESTACGPSWDLAHLDGAAVEVGVEQGHALRRARRLLDGVVRVRISIFSATWRGRGPDLAAVDDVAVAVAHRPRLERVVSSPTSGSVTAKQAFSLAGDQRRQPALFCSSCRTPPPGAARRCSCAPLRRREPGPRLRDSLHDQRRLGDAEARCRRIPPAWRPRASRLRRSPGGIRAGSRPRLSFCSQ